MNENRLPTPLELLEELIALPGPPGQEDGIRAGVVKHLDALGLPHRTDAKGNLLTTPGAEIPESPRIVVTAHLDEIALMTRGLDAEGGLAVMPLGGVFPYKWGEGPVEILPVTGEPIPGILSFGSIHTTSPLAAAQHNREGRAITWDAARVLTGRATRSLMEAGVRPGTRVVMARERRKLWRLSGGLVSGYFLDDRADLVTWLLALQALAPTPGYPLGASPSDGRGEFGKDVLFVATTSEEVGGEGAQFVFQSLPKPPDICVALEIGPITPDAPFALDARPSVWVTDSYATSDPRDLEILHAAGLALKIPPHFHAVTRGGSDASCAASRGLCARPVTIAFPAENSHGFEIMHEAAVENLAGLLLAYLNRV